MKRINVLKTYKLFINGKHCRTESGRFFPFKDSSGNLFANISMASRKDLRNSVAAARKAQLSWMNISALNRGQILYRIAEMLEDRKKQFIDYLMISGSSKSESKKEVDDTIDRLIYYAGWSDKYQQIFSSVNPVSTEHLNFTLLEPSGVVSLIAAKDKPLLGLASLIAPIIVGGNSIVALASNINPMIAISFSEVLSNSDVPSGVVNILTGDKSELLFHFATHKDIDSIVYCGSDINEIEEIGRLSAENLKRVHIYSESKWESDSMQSPYFIKKCQEIKTVWHPTKV